MTVDESIAWKLDTIQKKFNFYRQWNDLRQTTLVVKNWATPREKRRILKLILSEDSSELRKLIEIISTRQFTERRKK